MNHISLFRRGLLALSVALLAVCTAFAQPTLESPRLDDAGRHINCHGGCLLRDGGRFLWYGECRTGGTSRTDGGGVALYTSTDLHTWHDCGLVMPLPAAGDIVERPKVVYNTATGQYVMLFHHELAGRGYGAALTGFAVSDKPEGPFRYVHSLRPNAGQWPADFSAADRQRADSLLQAALAEGSALRTWWSEEWREAVRDGLYLARDREGGQMARDMTVFLDTDGTAWHVYSSEENMTLHLARLSADFLHYTGEFYRIAAGGQNEAPVLFRKNGAYWLITSGCTGWAPNKARLFRAERLTGPWQALPCPCRGDGAERTFGAQGAFAFSPSGAEDDVVFAADIWCPDSLGLSRHLWLPVQPDITLRR